MALADLEAQIQQQLRAAQLTPEQLAQSCLVLLLLPRVIPSGFDPATLTGETALELADAALHAAAHLMPVPEPPVATGDASRDARNLDTYQQWLTLYAYQSEIFANPEGNAKVRAIVAGTLELGVQGQVG
jgi:hypothetical protein